MSELAAWVFRRLFLLIPRRLNLRPEGAQEDNEFMSVLFAEPHPAASDGAVIDSAESQPAPDASADDDSLSS